MGAAFSLALCLTLKGHCLKMSSFPRRSVAPTLPVRYGDAKSLKEGTGMKTERILLPVDGSESSYRAAYCVAQAAQLCGAEVLLLHCVDQTEQNGEAPLVDTTLAEDTTTNRHPKQADALGMATANDLIGPVRDILEDHGIRYMERIVEGEPATCIPRVAQNTRCGLIVMGRSGKTPSGRLPVGSVTGRVVGAAHCPVIVAP